MEEKELLFKELKDALAYMDKIKPNMYVTPEVWERINSNSAIKYRFKIHQVNKELMPEGTNVIITKSDTEMEEDFSKQVKANMEALTKRVEHVQDRAQAKSDLLGQLDPAKHSVWGGWSKGYFEGMVAACEIVLDKIEGN